MGVPKFFRYISERYPCLSELVKEYQIPEFDNLYLDMNGIIHMCSHPNDFDPHFRITEEKIFQDIFHYLEILFRMIQPKKLFFMAVDGVAPRAKMNQQRGRRFRSAKEAEVLEERAKAKGEKLPSVARFDSNCITPGTVFMARLHEQLKYFISLKMSTDKLWKDVKVILSGHETPGEGEHKIMDYIRWMRAQPGYDPNTRHCLYGLDADLIMLGLCTHEPHFSLLREEVKFGKKASSQRCSAPEETKFYLLHLSLMREYLELEFQELKDKLSFPFDLESIIDDWVLMGFLVGNDFIPHLPDVHIASGALPMLYKAYIEVLPTLDGYINEKGILKVGRFQKFMEKLSAFDIHQFKENYADAKYFESKTGRKMKSDGGNYSETGPGNRKTKCAELDALIKATEEKVFEKFFEEDETEDNESSDFDDVDVFSSRVYDNDSDSDMSDLMKMEFHQQKKDYYRNKMEYGKVTQQVLRDQAEGYVRAIQWNLHYYYHGVASWSWFYPHHYAPYISDICNFTDVNLNFELGEPFRPFEQLLAVLPAASKNLLPSPYQELMIQESSPIIQYYPSEFRTDLNGKKQDWEAVVLIPFIAEDQLLKAMGPCYNRLTAEEKKRNEFGPMMVYTYSSDDLGKYDAPEYFTSIKMNKALATQVWREDLRLNQESILHGLLPGVKLNVYFPGFPTFKHLPYKGKLKKAKVHVFDSASRGENMILTLVERSEITSLDLKTMADQYLGKDVFCGWPHLSEARVVAVADKTKRLNLLSNGKIAAEVLAGVLASQWSATAKAIEEGYMNRQGVTIGQPHLLLYAAHVEGRKYFFGPNGKITLQKTHHTKPTPYALQTVVKDIAVHDPSFVKYKTLEEVFPAGSVCFLISRPLYGAMGIVVDYNSNVLPGRVKVVSSISISEPDIALVRRNSMQYCTQFYFGNKAAQRIGISSHVLSRITGTVYIITGNKLSENPSKVNIGLNLKFNKKNEEVPGYTKKDNNQWLYSNRAIDVVKQYVELFPEVFEHISQQSSNDVYDDRDIFSGNDCNEKVNLLSKWLKTLPCSNIERRACGSEVLDIGVIEQIDSVIKQHYKSERLVKKAIVQVKPHVLYKSDLSVGNLPPDPTATYMLFDRVVNVREDSAVPLGLQGVIIGIHKAEKDIDILYDIFFDQVFPGGLSLGGSPGHSYRMSRAAFINLSHGQREDPQSKTPANSSSVVQNVERPASAFASWNSRGGKSNVHAENWRSEMKNPSKRGSGHVEASQGFNFPAPPNVSAKHMTPMQSSSQEQLLWNNLQKITLKNVPPSSTALNIDTIANDEMKSSEEVTLTKKEIASSTYQSQGGSDSGTNVLKKILGIQQDNLQTVSLRPQSFWNQNPTPAVSKTGETNTEKKSAADQSSQFINGTLNDETDFEDPCGRLLSVLQSRGAGVPAYTYFHQQHGSTRAEVRLPDGNIVFGDDASNKHLAAENVARKALKSTGLISSLSNPPPASFSSHQQQFQCMPFPPPPRQPVPPVILGSHGWAQVGPSHIRGSFSRGNPQPFQAFPPSPRKKSSFPFHNNQRPRGDADDVSKHGHMQASQRSQPRTQDRSLKYSDQKSSSFETRSFVPLQAMKQKRNAVKSASLLCREHDEQFHTASAASSNLQSPAHIMENKTFKFQGEKNEEESVDVIKSTVEKSNDQSRKSLTSSDCEKTISESQGRSVSRMRKSRLAINFDNLTNDS